MNALVVVVIGCVLVASSPWWLARSVTGRRAARLAGVSRALGRRGTGGRGMGGRAGGGRTGEPVRGRRPEAEGAIDTGVILELLAAAVRAGASVPRALDAVGVAVGGSDGACLRRASAALVLGSSWDGAWVDVPRRLDVVRRALRPAWLHGAGPVGSLRAAGDALRQERAAAARTAAARLGVHLVLPLGACFLPAFVLVGLLPVLLSLGSGVLGG
ncbi:type II secretion system F family protein [Cellulosimicrobium sp. PMB13]|uniref:type II secretion system F family protein n=1 Tax=Cellulosimicrobium sp. PMB13 TaxID=3120158 RepID=UPI003F4B4585